MAVCLSAITFQACDTDGDNWQQNLPNALVTVKQNGDATYLQLDDNTVLYAKNLSKHPFGGKQVRALVNYSTIDEKGHQSVQAVNVNWIDSILTKKTVPSLATTEENDKKYGNDEVDIVRDWVTVAEDGYLTLRFRAFWGSNRVPHRINLLTGVNSENPYEVELRHDLNGDVPAHQADALVAFDLNDVLPDTEGKTVKLTLRWKSTQGDKKVEFDYCSRKGIVSSMELHNFSRSAFVNVK